MRMRMSKVSTIGCLKYSSTASECRTDTSTPWNERCCLEWEEGGGRRRGEKERGGGGGEGVGVGGGGGRERR